MIKRSLIFTSPATLSLRLKQLLYSPKNSNGEQRSIPIEDIGVIIIENQQIVMTIPLITALSKANVAVIFCNSEHYPQTMLHNLDSNSLQGEILRSQLSAGEVIKKQLWKQVITAKIKNQAALLKKYSKNYELLKPLYSNVKSGDVDNREGIAAKIYWQQLFGASFVRNRGANGANSLLNYGYTVLRAAITRSLFAAGLYPALGIFHHNRSNAFPLADDMMEPFRPFVDETVYQLSLQEKTELNNESKQALIKVLSCDVCYGTLLRPLSIGLSLTMASLARCYTQKGSKLTLPTFL